jgi:hypothetical protein
VALREQPKKLAHPHPFHPAQLVDGPAGWRLVVEATAVHFTNDIEPGSIVQSGARLE